MTVTHASVAVETPPSALPRWQCVPLPRHVRAHSGAASMGTTTRACRMLCGRHLQLHAGRARASRTRHRMRAPRCSVWHGTKERDVTHRNPYREIAAILRSCDGTITPDDSRASAGYASSARQSTQTRVPAHGSPPQRHGQKHVFLSRSGGWCVTSEALR